MSVYTKIQSIPIIGTMLYIANCYAYHGDLRSHKEFAGFRLWFKAFSTPVLLSAVLSFVTLSPFLFPQLCHYLYLYEVDSFIQNPGSLIISVIPSLLGFGIGVYALVFALSGQLINQLHLSINKKLESGDKTHGSVLVLNAEFALPLLVLIISISIGVFQKIFSGSLFFLILGWIAFWIAVVMLVEMIGVIFGLADNSLLDKTQKSDSN